nr:hypothetical protein [Lysobacter enzymogenes]
MANARAAGRRADRQRLSENVGDERSVETVRVVAGRREGFARCGGRAGGGQMRTRRHALTIAQ